MNESPPLEVPADADIHRRVCELIGQHESFGVNFASDGGPLQRIGLECVLFGPGDIENAHRPNEYVPIDEMTRCREVLETLVSAT
jgi:acetylornithine deacetylase